MHHMEHASFGQLPAICIKAPDGAQATVTLFGAHVVSWIPAGGQEQLFCSSRSARDGSKAIRGGIPLIFPQFSERGAGMRHGFARVSHWRLAGSGVEGASGFAEFALDAGDRLGSPWPHAFSLLFRVAVHENTLDLSLRVRNAGQAPFSFSSALHTYFAVADIASAEVHGLHGGRYEDQTLPGAPQGTQESSLLTCTTTLDRIYYATPTALALKDAARERALSQHGFVDTVVWNPGAKAGLSDMDDEEYRHFICIEPACIEPVELPAGAEWLGRHEVTVRNPGKA